MENVRILTWNCRGLRNKKKRSCILRLLKKNRYDIIALQKTYLTEEEISLIQNQWRGTIHMASGSKHSSGIIILFSKKNGKR